MTNFNVKSIWWLPILAICVLSLCHDHKMVVAEDCEEELRGLNIECMYYMNKDDPSLLNPNGRCCKAITDAYPKLGCVCKNLSRKVVFPPYAGTYADLISWRRVMHCFSYCWRPLPADYKCNRFTVPNPPPK
ncbi:hypothetical protein HKD37_13G036900 [Glycine soja]